MRLALVLTIAACAPSAPPPPAAPPRVEAPVAPACTTASIDRVARAHAKHPVTVTDAAIFEYADNTVIRRSLTGEATRVIPTGFAYGQRAVVGGGYVWWIEGVRPDPRDERAISLELWAASDRGGAPTGIPGELAMPVDLYAAPDGVFVATRDELLHIDHAGNRRVELAAKVDALAVTGDTVYLAIESSIVRRKLSGGPLELVATLSSQGQVRELVALGDRAVWFDTNPSVETNRPGSEAPIVLGTMRAEVHVAASSSELYVVAGNVVYTVGDDKLHPIAKARGDIAAFGADAHAIYAVVEQAGLVRLCPGASSLHLRAPRPDLDCPASFSARWAHNLRHVCVDPAGNLTDFHRDWYFSGDLEEERTPDGRFTRWWADGSPIIEGHYDELGLEDGEWLEYTDDGVQVTRYANGQRLP